MKYKIMWNWENNQYGFDDDSDGVETVFDTVGEAITCAMKRGYTANFIIVNVIDWENLIEKSL